MISRNTLFLITGFAVVLSTDFARGQTVELSKELKVDVKGVKAESQYTPQIQATNVNDKRWKPKNWLEVDVAFEAKKAKTPGDTSNMVDSVDFKYFVALNKTDKDGKYVLLTANITYLNVIEKEAQHAMAFVSPAALERLLEKTTFSNADIKAVGVEIYRDGALAGWNSNAGGRFWEKLDGFAVTDGLLLPKVKTPFSVLWGDYDLESKQ
jgi:hypothetical protein